MPAGKRWDIFCTVIDNYGDIGITWRLARQLAHEHGLQVRLWVDDLESFRHIRPEVRPELPSQQVFGVDIRHWGKPLPAVVPGDVVIEALACHLPVEFEQAMAQRQKPPIWLNLEYLSAEDWVAGCHGLPSPHPRLPLTKYFFMPGYVAGTGGVLRERDLLAERDAFQASTAAQNEFWQAIQIPPHRAGETRVSLFSYESAAIADLFKTWTTSDAPVRCLVPVGKSLGEVSRFFGRAALGIGETQVRGNLTVHILPMLDQDGYDRLLWACDCNFVRGEDSFIRAQWAGKPLIWQAYRQEEGAHWPKIEAFLKLYCEGLPEEDTDALCRLWRLWNEDGPAGEAWPAFWARRRYWAKHAAAWITRLEAIGDLTDNLVKFCNEKSK
jgi:uncharacterized repeat protein (TIGR03837 family)